MLKYGTAECTTQALWSPAFWAQLLSPNKYQKAQCLEKLATALAENLHSFRILVSSSTWLSRDEHLCFIFDSNGNWASYDCRLKD